MGQKAVDGRPHLGPGPGFPFCLPPMAPLYTRPPPSARNSVHRTIVQLQSPSPQPALTCDRLEPDAYENYELCALMGTIVGTVGRHCPWGVLLAAV